MDVGIELNDISIIKDGREFVWNSADRLLRGEERETF